MRCVRVGKMTIAALEATLRLYADGMEKNLPSLNYLTRPIHEINEMAVKLSERLGEILSGLATVSAIQGRSQVGSGSLPIESIDSRYVAIQPATISVDKLAELFRRSETPIIGRIYEGTFIMDMRTIYGEEAKYIEEAAEAIGNGLKTQDTRP